MVEPVAFVEELHQDECRQEWYHHDERIVICEALRELSSHETEDGTLRATQWTVKSCYHMKRARQHYSSVSSLIRRCALL